MKEDEQAGLGLIWGQEAIGKFIGVSRRKAQYLLSTGQIPGKRLGERWYVDRAKLEAFMKGEAA